LSSRMRRWNVQEHKMCQEAGGRGCLYMGRKVNVRHLGWHVCPWVWWGGREVVQAVQCAFVAIGL